MCKMVIIENADFSVDWECSNCLKLFKATVKFEKSKTCPGCGEAIEKWIGIDDYEDEDEAFARAHLAEDDGKV